MNLVEFRNKLNKKRTSEMFRLHKSRLKLDFNFSNFQVLQVPKGWDKLFVSIISVETGKTIAKSGKASVRNGQCRWSDTLSEFIWISREDATEELEECLLKLVVTMGSARSSILGEAMVDLACYMSSKASVHVSLPLTKCNHGTTLQVKIQCLSTIAKFRGEKDKKDNPYVEDANADCEDTEIKSDASDSTITRSVGSSCSNCLDSSSHLGELGSRDTTFSASGSRNSFESMDGFSSREAFSPQNDFSGIKDNLTGRQDSIGCQTSSPFAFNQIDVASSSIGNAGLSKHFLEVAEFPIELRAEARLWEQNARKLMLDLEVLKKQYSEQSKNQGTIDVNLSESRAECDGLKQEIDRLNIWLEESVIKQSATNNLKLQSKDIEKALEDELKFQKEINVNLALQLQKTQESNIELVSILQELEATVEKQKMHTEFDPETYRNLELKLQQLQESQKNLENTIQLMEKTLEDRDHEIETERDLRTKSVLECEEEWKRKMAAKEEEVITLEAKFSKAFDAQGAKDAGSECGSDANLSKEIEALKEKVQELERDCNELTDENLELLFKLKEPGKDLQTCGASLTECHGIMHDDFPNNEVSKLKSQICLVEPELKNDNLIKGISAGHLQIQSIDFESKRTNLALQLQAFQDKAYYLEDELCKFRTKAEENEIEITSLQQQLKCSEGREAQTKDHNSFIYTKYENFDSGAADEVSTMLAKLCEQLQLYLANMKRHQCALCFPVNTKSKYSFQNLDISQSADPVNQKEQIEALLNNWVQLNKFFEAKIPVCEDQLQPGEEIRDRVTNSIEVPDKMVDHSSEDFSTQGFKSANMEQDSKVTDLSKETRATIIEIEEIKTGHLINEEEVLISRLRQTELETHISNLLKEKKQLEENMEIMLTESNITSKSLQNLETDMSVLRRSMDSQVSANKILQRKSSELESGEFELEVHISELEEENVKLSERISGLEAQVRYLTDERESTRSELHHSELHATTLQEEIRRLETESEECKINMKQKLSDMQKRWSESQEECKYLNRAMPKLQTTAENLIEECSLLQKSNRELRNQNFELHEHCTVLEAELRESRKRFTICSMKFGALEAELYSMLEEVSFKEKTIRLELDALIIENEKYNEDLFLEENLLHQMYLEKKVEVDSLRREVAHLTEKIYVTDDDSGRKSSEAILEVSSLRGDNAKLKVALKEINGKLKLSENKFDTLQTESGAKVQALSSELAASEQKQEILSIDHEKVLGLLEDVKANEQKLKSIVKGLELKLKASEYEKQQLLEEISGLKVQFQKIAVLQDDVVALKSSLDEAKFENRRLEASFQLLSGDYEDLKSERFSLVEKNSCMKRALSELEGCTQSKVSLEDKILRLEGDLTAREALSAQEAELKNELGRLRRTNSQFHRKIKCLEDEKEEWLQRAQALEAELEQKTVQHDLSKSSHDNIPQFPESIAISNYIHDELKLSEVNIRQTCKTRSSQAIGVDPVSHIQLHGNDLSDVSKAMFRAQLKSLLSNGEHGNSDAHKELTNEDDEAVKEEEYKQNPSLLMGELRSLHEQYFHMSLKYAEVEAQREELEMKLKGVNGRSWFS